MTFALPQEHAPTVRARRPAPPPGGPEARPVQEEANRIVLDKYGPPGVVVDNNFDIVHFRGHTGPYLEAASGEASLNVLKMARGGLLYPLRSALGTARRKRRAVRKEEVLVQRNGEWRAVNLEVLPLVTSRGDYSSYCSRRLVLRRRPRERRPPRSCGKWREPWTTAEFPT